MQEEGIDAFFLTNLTNIRYLSGFTGSNAFLLVGAGGAWFVSDGRYRLQAAEQVVEAEIQICNTHAEVISTLGDCAKTLHSSKIGFEGASVTVGSRTSGWELPPGIDKLELYFEGTELFPTGGWVEALRKVKEPAEIELMRQAAEMADAGLAFVLGRIEPGQTEKQIALDLEFYLRSNGAEDVSFDPIVATGKHSAYVHAQPSDRTVEKGEFLLFDLGCRYKGYCSDLSRTVVVGAATQRHKDMYEAVLAAQVAGLSAARAHMSCGQVDEAARSVLVEAGLGEAFSHGLGHGVGLEIHEEPSLKKAFEELLAPNNVITIEPGAYIEGFGGVRIEDLIVVQEEDAPQILSAAPKELVEL